MARVARSPNSFPAPSTAQPLTRWIILLITVATIIAYLPALNGGFLWDDDGHVTRTDLQSLDGLFRIWFDYGATQQYYPVLHSAFWIEHLFWGQAQLGYHLVNLAQHITVACLLGTLLRRLDVPGAWFAAAYFALHPVCVESVAWISEQKNTLSALFYLGAAIAYLRYKDNREPAGYLVASGLFALALLTKTVTASLPAALLVVTWWKHGRVDWRRDLLPLLPWFVAGAVMGTITAHFESELVGAKGADFALSALARALLTGRVVWFYLAKLIWPFNLSFIYPRWNVDPGIWWQWLYPLLALALLFALIELARRGHRQGLAAALLFGGTLFPVLGFFNVFPFLFSYVADHFQYLASLAFFALSGAAVSELAMRRGRGFSGVVGGILLAGSAMLTWDRAAIYRNSTVLYENTIAANPDCWLAHHNLAVALAESGQMDEAISHLETVRRLKPDYAPGLNHLGDDLTRTGRAAEAVSLLQEAIRLEPRYAEAHNNLGVALMTLNRAPEGLVAFSEAVKLQPRLATAQSNLGFALASSGRNAEALTHLEIAARLQPENPGAEVDWATALALTGRQTEARAHFVRAIQLAPGNADYRLQYGHALAESGDVTGAVGQFTAALELNPNHALAHLQLAMALRRLGRSAEAQGHYRTALQLDPGLGRQP